jgi:epoxyqueuosine reductase QueG
MKLNLACPSPKPEVGSTLRRDVVDEVARLGSTLIGFAPASRWTDAGEVAADYRPDAIWRLAKTVIVVGVPMLLPIVESTPSINYQEMYNASNVLLDQIAFRLALFLNGRGFPAIPISRDGYGNLEILLKKMPASFSHVYAGKYAGVGTIGFSHNLINPQFGPRVRYVSVFTAAEIEGDPVIEKDLCKKCELCRRLCPVQALAASPGRLEAEFDAVACTRHHQALVSQSRWPCGVCLKVCPIGEDRKLYQRTNVADYLREAEALRIDPRDARYKHLTHLRTHGSDV